MNDKQIRFADEFIKLGNATQAALNAGYSEKTSYSQGQRLLKNVEVKEYINKQMQELHKSNSMQAEEALSILSDIARGKRDEEVLILNPTTGKVERHTKKADNATVIKAITEILKRYPTAKQSEKLELELAKLKAQLNTDNDDDDEIIIIDDQADELEGLIDDL
ncbi:TPA: terminase small subunit [Streptococcus suis]|uniref:terminase small subunit n=1 Tax=Streptococcus suis TaxID=1307 RepID=UPI00022F93BA|nr:terminase small subunit [Streptococcus suis]AGE61228.1 putative phage terminase small subunit [Streptococcus phage phiST1]AER21685.1 putative small subunit of the terminase [Streptococcus suis ST1]MDW8592823.1 terminase small subunit [Streptococcus suis]MDW8622348.1 terminase small subunit [Streptococcus suis]NQK00181.1 terminase small subunit [Streptococcus suis]